ncbi:MAG: ADP-ribosylation factor-like protein [Candidatus Odinarchaeota archaeon]
MSKQVSEEPDKIILIGLAESGKTTIVKVITEGFVPEKNASYQATVEYKRKKITLLGKDLTLFDLGGQKVFLDRFVGDLAHFVFSKVRILVFVVDIERVAALSLAKYYLDLALSKLNLYSPKAPVYVLIHKTDLIDKEKVTELAKHTKTFLLTDLKKPLTFFETSIFTQTIFDAFASIFAEITGTRDTLERILDDFMKENVGTAKMIQLFENEEPIVKTSNFSHVSLTQISSILDVALQRIANNRERITSTFIESENNVHFVSFLDNGPVLFIQFSRKGLLDNNESIPTIHSKVIALAKNINSFYSRW